MVRRGHVDAGRIVRIENREVIRLLVLEDARLGIHVSLERAMAIEMVRRDVQNDRNFRAESLNRFQLKTGNFQHDHGFSGSALGQRDRGRADIAADERREIRRQS